jgi:hypothetical protein
LESVFLLALAPLNRAGMFDNFSYLFANLFITFQAGFLWTCAIQGQDLHLRGKTINRIPYD